jgi:hypothetical protein
MARQNQSFHPRLIINDHFDAIINQIDVDTECLLEINDLTEEKRNQLNLMREKQIEKIKEIEKLNLANHLPEKFDENEYRKKWSHVFDNDSLDFEQKIDFIKEELLAYDCVLFKQPKVLNGLDLWITSWYYNAKNLDFLRFENLNSTVNSSIAFQ